MDTHDTMIKKALANDAETERIILACCDQYESVITNASPIVCVDHETGETIRMFKNGVNNALFMAIREWNKMCKKLGTAYSPLPINICKKILERLCEGEKSIGVSQYNIESVIELLTSLREENIHEGWEDIVDGLIIEWVHINRVEHINSLFVNEGLGTWTAKDYIQKISNTNSGLEEEEALGQFMSGSNLLSNNVGSVARIKTGLSRLDSVLRGGFARGSTALIHAPSGGGKTVTATQLFAAMVKSNVKKYEGLYLSTEQEPRELLGRIISAELSIPFDLVKDGVDTTLLNERQAMQVERMMDSPFGEGLCLCYWTNPRNLSVKDRLSQLIDRYIKERGRLDFIVFDWLGDALISELKNTSNNMAKMYEFAAGDIKTISKERDITTILFTQTHDKQLGDSSYNKFEYLQDCKNLHNYVEVGIGISAISEASKKSKPIPGRMAPTNNNADAHEDKPAYKDEQYWYFQKLRKGVPKLMAVTREFEYQRWKGLHEVDPSSDASLAARTNQFRGN